MAFASKQDQLSLWYQELIIPWQSHLGSDLIDLKKNTR